MWWAFCELAIIVNLAKPAICFLVIKMEVSVPPPGFALRIKEDNPHTYQMGEVSGTGPGTLGFGPVMKPTGSGVSRAPAQIQLALFPAALLWASYLASLSLSFLSVCNSENNSFSRLREG